MADKPSLIEFRAFAGSKVDRDAGVIRDVVVCTANIKARGYDLWTDATTLKQMEACGMSKGQVMVRAKHGGSVAETVGWVQDFRIDGSKLRADLHLLESIANRDHYFEIAEKMPGTVGLSAAFEPPETEEKVRGRKMARCADLVAVDFAAIPAACPGGLFEARVDTPPAAMNEPAEPSLKDLLTAVNKLTETVTTLQQEVGEVKAAQESAAAEHDDTPLTVDELEELANMSDEQLKEIGVTRESVDAAIAEALNIAATEAKPGTEGEEAAKNGAPATAADVAKGTQTGKAATAASAAAAAAPAAAGAGATALEALTSRLTQLEGRLQAEKDEQERNELLQCFEAIEQGMERLASENDALRVALKNRAGNAVPTGPRQDVIGFEMPKNGHKPGSFEALVEFEVKENKLSKGAAIIKVARENPGAHFEYQARLGCAKPAPGDE